jgi:hypothetical protein
MTLKKSARTFLAGMSFSAERTLSWMCPREDIRSRRACGEPDPLLALVTAATGASKCLCPPAIACCPPEQSRNHIYNKESEQETTSSIL